MNVSDWISLVAAVAASLAVGATLFSAKIGAKSALEAVQKNSLEDHRKWLRESLAGIYFDVMRILADRFEMRTAAFYDDIAALNVSATDTAEFRLRFELAKSEIRAAFTEASKSHEHACFLLRDMHSASHQIGPFDAAWKTQARLDAEAAMSSAKNLETTVLEMMTAHMRSASFGGMSALDEVARQSDAK